MRPRPHLPHPALIISVGAISLGTALLPGPAFAAGPPAPQPDAASLSSPPSPAGSPGSPGSQLARVRAGLTRHEVNGLVTLPGPPRPPRGRPQPRAVTTTAGPDRASGTAVVTGTATAGRAAVAAAAAKAFGPTGPANTLVLYDSTGAFGWLGELYALAGGTLASHFGSVTAEPVTSYTAGQIENFTAAIYFGSTYNEPIPAAFLSDVQSTTRPVIWSGFNVWQLSGEAGSATATAFGTKYGWDPSTSYLDTTDAILSVSYKGRSLTRNALNTGGVLSPHITDASGVTVVATANCTTSGGTPANCDPIAQSGGTSLPWAVRSANLTYVGEIPFAYLSERDRYLSYADLLFPALAPSTAASMKAAVRLEDVSPAADPTVLRQFADYLSGQGVPFQVAVIPQYTDPTGAFNGGVAQTITLAQAPAVVQALKYMQTKGGTLIQHGYTHQYSTIANPYNGVSADDFEFYRSECSSTQNPPYQFGPCQTSSWVILEGALPGDSSSWAAGRVLAGRSRFGQAHLTTPTIFETPHYTASAADYQGMRTVYGTRYERELFFGGLLDPANSSANRFGQFFPYTVTDVYGSKVLPENLGNYEPVLFNNNPPRTAQDIIDNAAANLVVTQSTASLFFHPDHPLAQLQTIVTGIKGLGYTFVTASQLS